MKNILIFCFCCFLVLNVSAQNGFTFSNINKSKVTVPFKLINNLIVLPVNVNGVDLNFLLDTGVEETVLFSLDENSKIPLFDFKKIKLKGLGAEESIEGLRAYNNTLSLEGLEYKNHEIVIVLDQNFNFSAALGIEVHGIIGYHLFKNSKVKIDYNRKIVTLFNPGKYDEKRMARKFKTFDFELEGAKPYVIANVQIDSTEFIAKCLIDSGNSDGLWLFQNSSENVIVPTRNFEDYLGRGFSGDIFGKRAKVNSLSLGEFKFSTVATAFPDENSFLHLNMVDNRIGSVGGDFLRRFTVIFDYENQKIHLKKNKFYNKKFLYNVSGITIIHARSQWYKEEVSEKLIRITDESHYQLAKKNEPKFNFALRPVYEILTIRKNSSAEKVGLQPGDVVVKINEKRINRMGLNKVNQLLEIDKSRDRAEITVDRGGKEMKFIVEVRDLL